MEGGFLPWRQQIIIDNSPDLDSYGRPLPPPPSGYFWERREDRSWELKRFENTDLDAQINFSHPSVIEHIVMPGDTIQGICLRYRVSAIELRRHNNFSGNNIQFSSSLRIPIEHEMPISRQFDSNEVKLQRFKNVTQEDAIEASYYLIEYEWDLERSLTAWKEDKDWNDTHYHSKGTHSNTDQPDDDLTPEEQSAAKAKSSKRQSFRNYMSRARKSDQTVELADVESWTIVNGTGQLPLVAITGSQYDLPLYDDNSDTFVAPATESWKYPKSQKSGSEKIKNKFLSIFGRKNSTSENDCLINLDEGNVDPMLKPLIREQSYKPGQSAFV